MQLTTLSYTTSAYTISVFFLSLDAHILFVARPEADIPGPRKSYEVYLFGATSSRQGTFHLPIEPHVAFILSCFAAMKHLVQFVVVFTG